MNSRARSILVTGTPGVGKTTILRKVAEALPSECWRGFVTDEIRVAGRRVGFELSTLRGQRRLLAHVDLDSPFRVGRYGVDVAGLDEWLDETLKREDPGDIYLIDEIGKMECLSRKFCRAVREWLESGRLVIATVALRGGGFIDEVKQHADVDVWRATRANREELPERILRRLQNRSR